jgi:hypothetical protein
VPNLGRPNQLGAVARPLTEASRSGEIKWIDLAITSTSALARAAGASTQPSGGLISPLIDVLIKLGILKEDERKVADLQNRHDSLTAREREVMALLVSVASISRSQLEPGSAR